MRTSITELSVMLGGDGYVVRRTIWGAMNVEIGTFYKEFDATLSFKGLPDDMSPTPAWGYVIKGSIRVKYKNREEILNTGDVFYTEPGHTMSFEAGTEYVVFSPEREFEKVVSIVERNIAVEQKI